MPEVPYPTGYQGIDEFPRMRENLINMVNAGGNKVYQRPGILSNTNGVGACRGQSKFKNELYEVSGTKLIRVNEDKTIFDISTDQAIDIAGTAECVMVEGFSHLVIIEVTREVNGKGYWYDGTTLDEIQDQDFVSSIDVTYMNGRYVYIPYDGQPAFFSEPFEPWNISALSFFDAETQPDLNTGIRNFKQRLYIMGEDTTEVFRDTGVVTGSAPVPYQRIDGASIWTGLVSGHTLYGQSFAFLGKDKDNNFGIFMMGSGDAPRISNPAIDELLNSFYTVSQLRECTAHRLQWKGLDIAIFRLPFHTLFFNGIGWSFASTIATFEEKIVLSEDFKTWRANYITHCYGEYYVGDEATDDIGVLDEVATDYGEDVLYGFDTFARGEREAYFTAKSMNIDGLTGQVEVGLPERTVGLSVSDDGLTYGPMFFVGLGLTGQYRREISWELPGGLGSYENFMGIHVRTTAPVEFAGEGLTVDI